ncbi:hypothetical protein F5050DRAFT_1808196 [Lentinula boryana]|uniref:J domain-containing protein n=1 Tax=Lentinula boryana TaxID=40481 RepID=A0ABQ8QBT5_9AGAR|nr:hypothetical protein F5050DRAFT_1808196 [Lentinula boryana]
MYRASELADAYEALRLEQGVSLEVVKNAYKQWSKAALRTHPDKNPDNPDATTEFQRIGEAYNILLRQLDTSLADSFDDSYDSEDEYEDELQFYMFLFDSFMRDRARFYPRGHQRSRGRQQESKYMSDFSHILINTLSREQEPGPKETAQEQTERLRRSREEQEAAELRRQREAAVRRELKEQDRQQERLAAEQRQKARNGARKAKVQAQRQQAEDATHARLEKVQKNRSAVFRAARQGNAEEVKKGIWENDVDAAGGEIKAGLEEFLKIPPKDPKETLSHIAARKGDFELVKWLDEHNAEMEERDSQNRTAFHTAVQHGHHEIVSYLIEHYPAKDSDHEKIYALPPSTNVLSLALQSHEPQVVWMVLQPENELASNRDISNAWSWINSSEGRREMTQHSKVVTGDVVEKFDDICTLLSQFGGFSPPATPVHHHKNHHCPPSVKEKPQTNQRQPSRRARGRGRGRGRGRAA